ncbi:MAG: hypothetical protein EBU43_07950 [Actinobacteria bacterium]|nr:hypothetical protein [Actinomycetota bacterium]
MRAGNHDDVRSIRNAPRKERSQALSASTGLPQKPMPGMRHRKTLEVDLSAQAIRHSHFRSARSDHFD